jgi:hypothetical protein
LWKLLQIREIFDFELIRLFIEKGGHEAVIEILLSKQKGIASLVELILIAAIH